METDATTVIFFIRILVESGEYSTILPMDSLNTCLEFVKDMFKMVEFKSEPIKIILAGCELHPNIVKH